MSKEIGMDGFLLRWALALALVLGTYNPTGWSYLGWVFGDGVRDVHFGPPILIVGLILLIGWIFLVRTTFQAIGWLGVILGGALFAAVIWWILLIFTFSTSPNLEKSTEGAEITFEPPTGEDMPAPLAAAGAAPDV